MVSVSHKYVQSYHKLHLAVCGCGRVFAIINTFMRKL